MKKRHRRHFDNTRARQIQTTHTLGTRNTKFGSVRSKQTFIRNTYLRQNVPEYLSMVLVVSGFRFGRQKPKFKCLFEGQDEHGLYFLLNHHNNNTFKLS
jgi:hypothetical protein